MDARTFFALTCLSAVAIASLSSLAAQEVHEDQSAALSSRYEQNLVHLIKTLRKDFEAPKAKLVIATNGYGGPSLQGQGLAVVEAQLAVSREKGKSPEFQGNVKTMDARPFWRDKKVSPTGACHHYNHKTLTYMDVENALGWAMADMLKK